MAKEFRIKKTDKVDIVLQVNEYRGEKGITIREWLTSNKYTGWTKAGLRIPIEKWDEFKKAVNELEVE